MLEAVDENTIAVVPTFGVTYTGQYEFVAPIAAALDELQAHRDRHRHSCRRRQRRLSRALYRARTSSGISAAPGQVDQHVRAQIRSRSGRRGLGGLARNGRSAGGPDLFGADYLGGSDPTFAINFSRPAGQVIAQYYDFLRLGREGYTADPAGLLRHRAVADERDRQAGAVRIHLSTAIRQTGIPAVCFRVKAGAKPAIHCTTCPTGCCSAAGRFRPSP